MSNFFYSLLATIAIVIILIYGKELLLPFVLAIIVWFLIKVIRNFVKKIPFGKRTLPSWFQNFIAFALIFSILGLSGNLLTANISKMQEALPTYEQNIVKITEQINENLGIDVISWFKDYSGDFDISGILKSLFNSIYEILANTFMVILYVLFLLLEESIFPRKLKAIFSDTEKYEKVSGLLRELNQSINSYISLKTLISLITGILCYIVLLILGVDFAFFWAFLIFVLNYIPTIGSIIGTIFPTIFALLQFSTYTPCVLVLISIGAIEILGGNLIEPRIMRRSLNVSSLVVLLSLAFWGSIWGIVGMILSVPITMMMIIVFAHFPQTKSIAILLSGNAKT